MTVAVRLGVLALAPLGAAASLPLADLSLEELGRVEITSVSRRAQRLDEAAASVFVITGDMIRRSGAVSLPEALRLAPNLQVARIDAAQYAISARGFNNAIGNKLLVLIDGRTVYAPFFSGVYWDQQDVMLDDVDRIEVISGPGATLWGANAVNGVINVITRPAGQTQGTRVSAAAGALTASLAVRHGLPLGGAMPVGHLRVHAKAARHDATRTEAGVDAPDGWHRRQAGFRADLSAGRGQLTLQGDLYRARSQHRGTFGPFELKPVAYSGANLLARWTQRLAGGSDLRVQAYVDHTRREDSLLYSPHADVADLEFQHGYTAGRHQLLWGAGYRRARDDIEPGVFFAFLPPRRTMSWKNLFVQDTVRLGEALDLGLGVKLEHNGYTGTETLPSVRLGWQPTPHQLWWVAASRAVRAPARLDREIVLPPTPPYLIAGGPHFVAEVARVLEFGHRSQPRPSLNLSATLFWHDWDRLRSGQPPPGAQVQNMIAGVTYGVEAWGAWQATPAWRLSAGLSSLRKKLRLRSGSIDPEGPRNLGNDPSHQWMLRSALDLPHRQELDVTVRRVGALPDPAVPAYTAVDLRYGWRASPQAELSVMVENLFDAHHPEFHAAPGRSEIGRGVRVQLRWAL